MPSKKGEYCARCGRQCSSLNEGDSVVYYCPNGHGEQGRETREPEPVDPSSELTEPPADHPPAE